MDLLKKNLALTRYDMPENPMKPEELLAWTNWKDAAFKSIDHTEDEYSQGLVQVQDFEKPLTTPMQQPGCIILRLRIDKRRIPPTVLKRRQNQVLEQERKILIAQGIRHMPRSRRREIRAQVRKSLLRQTQPTPKTVGLILTQGRLWALTSMNCELEAVKNMAAGFLRTNLQLHSPLSDTQPELVTRQFLSLLYSQGRLQNNNALLWITNTLELQQDKDKTRHTGSNLQTWPEIHLGMNRGKEITQAGLSLKSNGHKSTFQLNRDWSMNSFKLQPAYSQNIYKAHLEKLKQLTTLCQELDNLCRDILYSQRDQAA